MQLSDRQLQHLELAFRSGADDASSAMAKWLGVPSLMTIESVEQQPTTEAMGLLGEEGEVVCFCVMSLHGSLSGNLVLSFDDASGLSLADLLLNQPSGTSTEWTDVEQSAALESHNIIGCAYLNTLAREIPYDDSELELIPGPPSFHRDFAESLMQSAVMSQAAMSETVFVAKARFELREQPLSWTMLLIPDAASMSSLQHLLAGDVSE